MGRSIRFIQPKGLYEVCFRARSGIPLPCTDYMNLLLKSAMARAQHHNNVTISHFVWMGNHVHAILIPESELDLTNFIMEVKRKITEYVKCLLGLSLLNLWEARPATIMEILDYDKAIERIAYILNNPVQANLAASIEDYQGLSSWRALQICGNSSEANLVENVPWIRPVNVPPLSIVKNPKTLVFKLQETALNQHHLTVSPNAWHKVFNVTDPDEIAQGNQQIRAEIEGKHDKQNEKRKCGELRPAMNKAQQRTQIPTLNGHTPKTRGTRVFFLSSCKEARIAFIEAYEGFRSRCIEAYKKWREGDFTVEWPPNAFIPWLPPLGDRMNAAA